MRFEHLGAHPRIHPTAVVAATAVISGDVEIGPDCQILHGAVITAEGGAITLGANVIVMENALIRATSTNPVHIADHVLVGPMASVSGAVIEDEVFLATGTRVFNGARIGARDLVAHLIRRCDDLARVERRRLALAEAGRNARSLLQGGLSLSRRRPAEAPATTPSARHHPRPVRHLQALRAPAVRR